ncbi:MAG: hypothetical protein AAGO57_08630 [Pseudomonadota bacterium]
MSTVLRDTSLVPDGLHFDPNDRPRLVAKEGREPSHDDLPVTIFNRYRDEPLTKLPSFFVGAGTISFERHLAGPLLNKNLGLTFVLPLQVLDYEQKEQLFVERDYYCIIRHNLFEALAPDESLRIGENALGSPPPWNFPRNPNGGAPNPRDGDIAVHARALEGPLIWYDEQLSGGLFFRGDLVEEMEDAGVAKYWQLKKCKIVD